MGIHELIDLAGLAIILLIPLVFLASGVISVLRKHSKCKLNDDGSYSGPERRTHERRHCDLEDSEVGHPQ